MVVRPLLVTMPILAHISCREAIRGKDKRAVQRVAKPNLAPA
jgi:hypothetical protein